MTFMPVVGIETWIGATGAVLGLAGVILAIVFYLKQRKIKRPLYSRRSVSVFQNLTDQYPELEIKYGGSVVTRLTVARLIFWNGGSETIESSDVAEADPIRVSAKDGVEILTVQSSLLDNEANHIKLQADGNETLIKFDFIDRGEGVVLNVVHTGVEGDVFVVGTVKGAGRVRRKKKPFPDFDDLLFPGFMLLVFAWLGSMALARPWNWIGTITAAIILVLLIRYGRKLYETRKPGSVREFEQKMSV